jgi:hypothetical protein
VPLPLDLNLLASDKQFQQLCFRLAQKEFPKAIAVAHGSWDGGRDVIAFSGDEGDIIWQCKFTQRSLSNFKPKVIESLGALDPCQQVLKWILCVSADGTGVFLDWLRGTLAAYPFIASWELWDREVILQRLEACPDIIEVFFYPVWKALESRFRTDELELVRFKLEPHIGWWQPDPNVLQFHQRGIGSDLVLDIIVRSRGTLQSLLYGLRIDLSDVRYQLKGLPGSGLLYSQHTYTVPLHGGKPGTRFEPLEPPPAVDASAHQRFKVKFTETGYAWTGYARFNLIYGDERALALPAIFLRA